MTRPIIGIDEVGLGPIVGPVTAAACLIDEGIVDGVRDSKMVAEALRFRLAFHIKTRARWTALAERNIETINTKGLATAHREIIVELATAARERFPDAEIIMDGKAIKKIATCVPFLKWVVGGDRSVYQIGAASLIAKAHRDQYMIALADSFPAFGWQKNKGYPTPEHISAVQKFGMTAHHRVNATKNALQADKRKGRGPMTPEEQVADFSPAKAQEYIERALAQDATLDDWSRKFVNDMRLKLGMGAELTPRQKFFLKTEAHRAEKKSRKQAQ